MAHVRRRDFLTKLVCEFISLPMSFHPIVGFLKRKIEREREMACDELVTRRAVLRESYARSLLKAADLSILPVPRTAALSIFDGRTLEQRIKQLIEDKLLWGRRTSRTITVAVVAAVCLLSISLSAFGFELRAKLNRLSPSSVSSAVLKDQP
jgi:beta-lactamase regulating signal transducer with metallopeptidase domain